ncbi:MAG TPA: tetratricopeptide repeat protein [Candidatus Saccharibacteria bacterium]|nr:tetratricopeptide repeat protein [Candidatus Saccharibacteria bacterium]HMT39609.1 tetratricopeptide repeat protein [Candidatus Saccharibacteria bacterium]
MIFEVVLISIVVIFTILAVVKKRSSIVDSIIANLSVNPPSQDETLDNLLDIAGRYYAEKNYLAAEKAYLKVLRVDHKNSLAYSRLGFIYSHLGNNEDAIECFKIVADTYPNAASFHNLSMMYFKTREYQQSADALEKSLSMEMHINRLVNLARIYRILNKFDKQLSTLKKAIDLDPKNVEIMQLLAEAYLHEKDEKSANHMFEEILKIEPHNQRARTALGQTSNKKINI